MLKGATRVDAITFLVGETRRYAGAQRWPEPPMLQTTVGWDRYVCSPAFGPSVSLILHKNTNDSHDIQTSCLAMVFYVTIDNFGLFPASHVSHMDNTCSIRSVTRYAQPNIASSALCDYCYRELSR